MLTADQHQQQKQGRVVIRTLTHYLINSRSSLEGIQQRRPKWQTSSSKNARGMIHNPVLLLRGHQGPNILFLNMWLKRSNMRRSNKKQNYKSTRI